MALEEHCMKGVGHEENCQVSPGLMRDMMEFWRKRAGRDLLEFFLAVGRGARWIVDGRLFPTGKCGDGGEMLLVEGRESSYPGYVRR